VELGNLSGVPAAAIVSAGLLSVVIFIAVALSLLRESSASGAEELPSQRAALGTEVTMWTRLVRHQAATPEDFRVKRAVTRRACMVGVARTSDQTRRGSDVGRYEAAFRALEQAVTLSDDDRQTSYALSMIGRAHLLRQELN
jgi:hypothetical protein